MRTSPDSAGFSWCRHHRRGPQTEGPAIGTRLALSSDHPAAPARRVHVSVLKRFTSWICVIGAVTLLAWPADADAQRRRGGRRVVRPVIRTSFWYGPRFGFYSPYFYGYNPYFYRQSAFGPWGPFPYGIRYEERGSIRIQVKPEETEVYVDGYYAGVVDSYDGFFQRLHLPAGEHEIELRLEGHRSMQGTVVSAGRYDLSHPSRDGAARTRRDDPAAPGAARAARRRAGAATAPATRRWTSCAAPPGTCLRLRNTGDPRPAGRRGHPGWTGRSGVARTPHVWSSSWA